MAKYRVVEETLGSGIKQWHIEKGMDTYAGYSWSRVTTTPFESFEAVQSAAKFLYENSVIAVKNVLTYG